MQLYRPLRTRARETWAEIINKYAGISSRAFFRSFGRIGIEFVETVDEVLIVPLTAEGEVIVTNELSPAFEEL